MVTLALSCCLHYYSVLCLTVRQSEANTCCGMDQGGAVKCIVVLLLILFLRSGGEDVFRCND